MVYRIRASYGRSERVDAVARLALGEDEEHVGLVETGDGLWDVYFGPVLLGRFHEPLLRIEDAYGRLARNPNYPAPVLPMSLD